MALRDPALAIHIAAGTTGLILGPIAMRAPKRRGPHTRLGEVYHWILLVVCASATLLAVLSWGRLWGFLPVAAFSYANALVGYVAAKRRWRRWLRAHIAGMGGSYIALVTALLVVNVGQRLPLVWFVPTVVGSPLIAWVISEVDRGRRPRLSRAPSQGGA
jgi:peptidoglycan/LPS O-acetylase OafA/YrhL